MFPLSEADIEIRPASINITMEYIEKSKTRDSACFFDEILSRRFDELLVHDVAPRISKKIALLDWRADPSTHSGSTSAANSA
jgi:hypothetical protein